MLILSMLYQKLYMRVCLLAALPGARGFFPTTTMTARRSVISALFVDRPVPESLPFPLELLAGIDLGGGKELERCYKASVDGWRVTEFHRCVDRLCSVVIVASNPKRGGSSEGLRHPGSPAPTTAALLREHSYFAFLTMVGGAATMAPRSPGRGVVFSEAVRLPSSILPDLSVSSKDTQAYKEPHRQQPIFFALCFCFC